MRKKQPQIVLQRKGRAELERLLADGNTAQKIAKRARIVLMSADGHGVMAIMREAGVSKTTVWRWQEYFVEAGVGGLIKGRTKPPGKKPISAAIKLKIVEKTVKEHPAAATHWSVRTMAEEMGVSHTSVQRIWAEHGLKSHQVKSFKVSNDPDFAKKVEDIVGLYLDREGARAVHRREEPDSGARPHPARPAPEEGTRWHDDQRLQAQRHDNALRRA